MKNQVIEYNLHFHVSNPKTSAKQGQDKGQREESRNGASGKRGKPPLPNQWAKTSQTTPQKTTSSRNTTIHTSTIHAIRQVQLIFNTVRVLHGCLVAQCRAFSQFSNPNASSSPAVCGEKSSCVLPSVLSSLLFSRLPHLLLFASSSCFFSSLRHCLCMPGRTHGDVLLPPAQSLALASLGLLPPANSAHTLRPRPSQAARAGREEDFSIFGIPSGAFDQHGRKAPRRSHPPPHKLPHRRRQRRQ